MTSNALPFVLSDVEGLREGLSVAFKRCVIDRFRISKCWDQIEILHYDAEQPNFGFAISEGRQRKFC